MELLIGLPVSRRPALVMRVLVLVALGLSSAGCRARSAAEQERAPTRTVVDMRPRTVQVPLRPTRVATISDGFVESVMTRLGVIRTLVALGSSSQQRTWTYTFPTSDGRGFTVSEGMGTMRALHPWLSGLPCASPNSGDGVNYETLARTKPDVVIVRVGDCTLRTSPEVVERTTTMLESLGIPVIVLRSPADYAGQGLGTLREEIEVLGRLFRQEEEASALTADLPEFEQFVTRRAEIPPGEGRPTALYLGLASGARRSGGAAYTWGRETAESWLLERLAGGVNAYAGTGARVLLNTEHILSLDPDVIFLPTSNGYHPAQELLEAPHFRSLKRLRAIRNRRVYPLPFSPMNCARRLEYPIDLMIVAKGLHPGRFADVALNTWVLDFYKRIYRVDDDRARLLRRAQWLE